MKITDLETVTEIADRLKSLKAMREALNYKRPYGPREGVRLRLVISNIAPEECTLDMSDAREIVEGQIAKLKTRLESLGVTA